MKVICDKCKKEFEVKKYTRKIIKDIREEAFNCSHCNEKYNINYTNSKIRKLMEENGKLYRQMGLEANKNTRKAKITMKRIVEKTELIENLIKELKKKVEANEI